MASHSFCSQVGRKDGPMPGEDEPLHAFVSGTNLESVKKAVDKVTFCCYLLNCTGEFG